MSDLKMKVDVNVRDRILKPVNEVFAAFVDPAKMSQYFISGASGPMKAGTKVEWELADVGAKVLIDVLEVEENRRIVFEGARVAQGVAQPFNYGKTIPTPRS